MFIFILHSLIFKVDATQFFPREYYIEKLVWKWKWKKKSVCLGYWILSIWGQCEFSSCCKINEQVSLVCSSRLRILVAFVPRAHIYDKIRSNFFFHKLASLIYVYVLIILQNYNCHTQNYLFLDNDHCFYISLYSLCLSVSMSKIKYT